MNLVANLGFESMSGDPLMPDAWSTYKGSGATVFFAAKTDVVYGTYSLKIAAREGRGERSPDDHGIYRRTVLSFWLYDAATRTVPGKWMRSEIRSKSP